MFNPVCGMQGGLENGILRWSLEIVRQCDMFWMGVTSNSGLDMSTMIARNPQVWMISEEGTCIEHCRSTPSRSCSLQISMKCMISLLGFVLIAI